MDVLTIKNRLQAVHLILAFQYIPGMPCTRVSLILLNKVKFFLLLHFAAGLSQHMLGTGQGRRAARFHSHREERGSAQQKGAEQDFSSGCGSRSRGLIPDSRGPFSVGACSGGSALLPGLGSGCCSPLAPVRLHPAEPSPNGHPGACCRALRPTSRRMAPTFPCGFTILFSGLLQRTPAY